MKAAIFAGVASFALRVGLLVSLPHAPVIADQALYDQTGRQLAGLAPGAPLAGFYRGFGYPLVLAGIFDVSSSYLVVRLVQSLLLAVATGLVVLIARRLFGARAAGIAAILVLLEFSILPHSMWLLTENVVVPAIIGALAALILLRPSRPVAAAVVSGALLGFAALSHPGWALFAPLALLLLGSRRLVLTGYATCAVIVLVVMIPLHIAYPGQPWTMGKGDNAGYGGGSAWTFYIGTRTSTNGNALFAEYIRANKLRNRNDSYYWKAGLRNIRDHPIPSVGLWIDKQGRLLESGAATYATGSAALDVLMQNSSFINSIIVVLGGFGLVFVGLKRRDRWTVLALAAAPIYTALVFATLTTGEARYGYVARMLLVIPASAMIAELFGPEPSRATWLPGARRKVGGEPADAGDGSALDDLAPGTGSGAA